MFPFNTNALATAQKLQFPFVFGSFLHTGYLKIHWTYTNLVCAHLNTFHAESIFFKILTIFENFKVRMHKRVSPRLKLVPG